jgi:hypothetical protein
MRYWLMVWLSKVGHQRWLLATTIVRPVILKCTPFPSMIFNTCAILFFRSKIAEKCPVGIFHS